ncbi:MAG: hypothetical protein QMB63_07260 [Clostridiaceae bacterium]
MQRSMDETEILVEESGVSKREGFDFLTAFKYAGAIIALLIGSGFATGQEIVQYFTAFGWYGVLSIGLMFILLSYVMIEFMRAGKAERFENGNDIFYYYGGKIIGAFYDYFSIFFIFLTFTVMIAGAGATGEQQFGWPIYYGGIAIGILAILTCITGLTKIVDIIGAIGPVIAVLAIILGIMSIVMYFPELTQVSQNLAKYPVMKASPNWVLSSLSYVGFSLVLLAAFLSQIGKNSKSMINAKAGAIMGASGFSLAIFIGYLGLLAALPLIAGSQIPNLVIAANINPRFAFIFSILIFAGIFTTTVPLLWSVVARFSKEETPKFRVLTVFVGILGIVVGLLMKFDKLVNIVYVLNGYVGIFLIVLMLVKTFTRKKKA